MKTEFKDFEFKVEASETKGEVGYIKGYASTFGNVDLGNDIVEAGAFSNTIKKNNGQFPVLLDHNPTKQVGWTLSAVEDSKGLKVEAEIQLITEEARNRYQLARRAQELGTKMGLSIGYETLKHVTEARKNGLAPIRRLTELNLHEYSFVTFPMNVRAGVTAAKAEDTKRYVDTLYAEGKSFEEIFRLLSGNPMVAKTESNDESAYRSIVREAKRISALMIAGHATKHERKY